MSYQGASRAFVLRFLNQGTGERTAGTRGGHLSGNRGSIAARNFFEPLAGAALNVVSQHLAQIIEQEIANAFNDNENNS